LPKTLEPLHQERSGLRQAGLWLAEHTLPVDPIEDPLCWSHYYAGRVFFEHTNQPVPPGHHIWKYVVLEETGNEHPRLAGYRLARDLVKDQEPVYTWSGKRGKKHARVLIYAVPLS
jgi:hypothetical protein